MTTVAQWIPAYRQQIHPAIGGQMVRDAFTCYKLGLTYQHWWTDISDIARARNMAVEKALEHGFDYLMMQDSDIFCPSGSPLEFLLATMRAYAAAMVAAPCGLRRPDATVINCVPFKQGEVHQVESVGAGMLLIDMRKVRRIAEQYEGPWFARTHHDKRCTSNDIGEDIFFCKVLRGHDAQIWVDGRIETVHAYLDTGRLHYRATPAQTGEKSDDNSEGRARLVTA